MKGFTRCLPTTSEKARIWSDKLGYLLLKIGAEKRYIAKNVIIYTAEQVARILFSEVSMDVLQMTGNDPTPNRLPTLWNWPR